MTFKIVLTALFVANVAFDLGRIDEPRKPISAGTVLVSLVVNAVLVYGIWSWL